MAAELTRWCEPCRAFKTVDYCRFTLHKEEHNHGATSPVDFSAKLAEFRKPDGDA